MLALWSYATSGRAAWSISSSGSASSTIPCAAATALPSSTSPETSLRNAASSHTRPCVSPVSAPIGFVAALEITFRHSGPRAGPEGRDWRSSLVAPCGVGARAGAGGGEGGAADHTRYVSRERLLVAE